MNNIPESRQDQKEPLKCPLCKNGQLIYNEKLSKWRDSYQCDKCTVIKEFPKEKK